MIRPTRFYSSKQEKKVAQSVQGKVVANSGATQFHKGDVQTDLFLIECKTCTREKQSFSIKREWLDKLREETFAMNKPYSALAFDYGDGKQWFVINEQLFNILQQAVKEEK